METKNLTKVSDHSLKEFATEGDLHDRRSVIIELGAAPPKVELSSRVPHGPAVGVSQPPIELANIEGHGKLMDQLEQDLLGLNLPDQLVRLDAAQAFVATLTPALLRTVLQWPLAGRIHPNRVHKLPSTAMKRREGSQGSGPHPLGFQTHPSS
jgi:hypothetical protein